jgi:diaminopimelate epimerase
MDLIKAHAYGNDFLLAPVEDVLAVEDPAELARRACARHTGVGADGLMFVTTTVDGAVTRLRNADGSRSEISGNGIRCVAAWLAGQRRFAGRERLVIRTEAGDRIVELQRREGNRVWCRADMGSPRNVADATIDINGQPISCVVLYIGNPQCVVLGEGAHVSRERLHAVAGPLAVHPNFPDGTNVSLAVVEAPDRVRILIWERGVGPTEASGTGACGAAIAAHYRGGMAETIAVVSPGGTQHVEVGATVWLTGWAEVTADVFWRGAR